MEKKYVVVRKNCKRYLKYQEKVLSYNGDFEQEPPKFKDWIRWNFKGNNAF
jgi:hypothetical protein